ncbi:MAG: type II toxin-antitoxin system Phd/YefM family antitoxin [Methylomagnum sp.]
MNTYTVHNAKTHLSSLIDQACTGEEAIIARGEQPLVKPVPLGNPGQGRRFGAMRGQAVWGRRFSSLYRKMNWRPTISHEVLFDSYGIRRIW